MDDSFPALPCPIFNVIHINLSQDGRFWALSADGFYEEPTASVKELDYFDVSVRHTEEAKALEKAKEIGQRIVDEGHAERVVIFRKENGVVAEFTTSEFTAMFVQKLLNVQDGENIAYGYTFGASPKSVYIFFEQGQVCRSIGGEVSRYNLFSMSDLRDGVKRFYESGTSVRLAKFVATFGEPLPLTPG